MTEASTFGQGTQQGSINGDTMLIKRTVRPSTIWESESESESEGSGSSWAQCSGVEGTQVQKLDGKYVILVSILKKSFFFGFGIYLRLYISKFLSNRVPQLCKTPGLLAHSLLAKVESLPI
jgi:hypothetical protein